MILPAYPAADRKDKTGQGGCIYCTKLCLFIATRFKAGMGPAQKDKKYLYCRRQQFDHFRNVK